MSLPPSDPLEARPLLVFGSRGSALARWQTDWAVARLQAIWPGLDCRVKLFTTSGDRIQDQPLPQIGGKGLFTAELEEALRAGEIDVAVHSLKDLPLEDAPGLALGAIGERDDPRDVLIGPDHPELESLPQGAGVGTCSLRRAAQLLAARPDFTILPLRGNVDTRIRKALAGEYDAILLAAAGVRRLGLDHHISQYLPLDIMLPAPGQAALAAQCRAGDSFARRCLAAIDHAPTRAAVTAERAFLAGLGGGCLTPAAAYAEAAPRTGASGAARLHLSGLVASADGRRVLRVAGDGVEPEVLGAELARKALANGAGALLA